MMKNIKRKHKLFKFQREKNLPIGGHYNARQTMEREVRSEWNFQTLKKYIKIEVNKNFRSLKCSISETISKTVFSLCFSWSATRCPGETWWTATTTTTAWPDSTAVSPASGTAQTSPDPPGCQPAGFWLSTSLAVDWDGLSPGWSPSSAVWTGGSSCPATLEESRWGTPSLLIKLIMSVLLRAL